MRQLGAEHHQREQQGAKQKPPRRINQRLAGEKKEESSDRDADRQRIDDESGIAPWRDEIIRRVDQFRNDDDVLVVVAKQLFEAEPHSSIGEDAWDVAPIVGVGERRPRRDGAAVGEGRRDRRDQRGNGEKDRAFNAA